MFSDRRDAGIKLSENLLGFKSDSPMILALPRGGVPVGYEIAKELNADFDIFVVRKIGVPWNPEFGVGAVSEGGIIYLDENTIARLGINKESLSKIIKNEKKEIERQLLLYRSGKPHKYLKNQTVIIVDDGLATGSTARCAIKAVKLLKPRKIIFAAPVCAYDTSQTLSRSVEIVCHLTPSDLQAVGSYYRDFRQVTDEEVSKFLRNFTTENKLDLFTAIH